MSKNTSEVLKDICQGEMSAAETYKQAIDKIGAEPGMDELLTMQRDHFEAVQTLQSHLNMAIEDTPDSAGPWGIWAKTVMGTAKLFGDKTALKALKEGEEHGLKQYRDALGEEIDPEVKSLIREKFIPRQENHIKSIDRLIDRVAS